MREIELTQGQTAIVDDEDYEALNVRSWCYHDKYAYSKIDGKVIAMHRHLLDAPKGMDVDHANGDTLDNRRCNIRVCTRSQNMQNFDGFKNRRKSRFKGLQYKKRDKLWEPVITVNGKRIYCGASKDEEQAARNYDRAAIKHFGEFAKTNFPKEDYNEL